MGRIYEEYVDGSPYRCRQCHCHLASANDLLSKQFHSKNGRAYLFTSVVNVTFGSKEERLMTTGVHVVRDAFCASCMLPVGWKYEVAYEREQKYKEGKFILECAKMETECSTDLSQSPSEDSAFPDFEAICP